tara:strand:+ start:1631 stop:2170 length:540 start_codon:yes stop_codon:yes gene_type:complete
MKISIEEKTIKIILVIFFIIWIITGIISLLYSLFCFGYDSTLTEKIIGFLIALITGPFYFIYYSYNKNYCKKYKINSNLAPNNIPKTKYPNSNLAMGPIVNNTNKPNNTYKSNNTNKPNNTYKPNNTTKPNSTNNTNNTTNTNNKNNTNNTTNTNNTNNTNKTNNTTNTNNKNNTNKNK